MPKPNPYLDEIQRAYVPEDLPSDILATLAIAHELREANCLTEAINTPPRFVVNSQNPISPEGIRAEMAKTKIMAVPDDSGDARIAEAARHWAKAYARRNEPGARPGLNRIARGLAELIRTVDEEDQR